MIFSDKDLSRAALAARVLRRADEAGAFDEVENAAGAIAAARGLLGSEFDDLALVAQPHYPSQPHYAAGDLPNAWRFQIAGTWDRQLIALFGDG